MQQNDHITFHVLIAAAGSGLRLGGDLPKQYIKIAGKTILRHTLDNVITWPGLGSLRVIIDPKHADLYHDAVEGLNLAPPIKGGRERKDSINNALNELSDIKDNDIVLVHDAARPFVEWNNVKALVDSLGTSKAATLATPLNDTIRRQVDNEDVERSSLYAVQTPQAMRYGDFKAAHAAAQDGKTYTDDIALARELGIEPALIPGRRTNFKITTPEDLEMAKKMIHSVYETRTGTGFDVHAFDDENNPKALIICGVEVPHNRALKGHSDADVGLHAITDAILGAIGQGDIGRHFPPSDDAYKDMDSAIFLQKAMDMVATHNGALLNLDLTLICESPKIGPHSDRMRVRVAEVTGLEPQRINIKATTTEGLGFTGRGEGIAAQAVANVKIRV